MDRIQATKVVGEVRELTGKKNKFVDKLYKSLKYNSIDKLSIRQIDVLQLIVMERMGKKKDGEYYNICVNLLDKVNGLANDVEVSPAIPAVAEEVEKELTLIKGLNKIYPTNGLIRSIYVDFSRCVAKKCAGMKRGFSKKTRDRIADIVDAIPDKELYNKYSRMMTDINLAHYKKAS